MPFSLSQFSLAKEGTEEHGENEQRTLKITISLQWQRIKQHPAEPVGWGDSFSIS